MSDWKARHYEALRFPRTPQERELVTILATLGTLDDLHGAHGGVS